MRGPVFAEMQDRSWARRPPFIRFTAHLMHDAPEDQGVRHVSVQVKTKDGKEVGTPNIVLATSSPLHHNLAIHSRQHPYRSYIVGLRIPEVYSPGRSICLDATAI